MILGVSSRHIITTMLSFIGASFSHHLSSFHSKSPSLSASTDHNNARTSISTAMSVYLTPVSPASLGLGSLASFEFEMMVVNDDDDATRSDNAIPAALQLEPDCAS